MRLSEKQAIFTRNVAMLIEYINKLGYECTFGDAYRTPEQAELYEKQGKGIKNSLHCKRLAIDLNLFKDGSYLTDVASYKPFGDFWKTLHSYNRWGGDFPKLVDANHFEMQDL